MIRRIGGALLRRLGLRGPAGPAAGDVSFAGNYASWDEAAAACGGYDDPAIFERVRQSVAKVRDGEALFERDSVLFYEAEYSASLLAGLFYIAAHSDSALRIVDFGGALGSTYYQNRGLFGELSECQWSVVEQAGFVEIGQREFQDSRLSFHSTMSAAVAAQPAAHRPNAVLFSSVLQYLPEPQSILQQAAECAFEFLLIDRTPFLEAGQADRITVERVPEEIYPASYPAWFFEYKGFCARLEALGYEAVLETNSWERWDLGDDRAQTRCMLYRRRG